MAADSNKRTLAHLAIRFLPCQVTPLTLELDGGEAQSLHQKDGMGTLEYWPYLPCVILVMTVV